MMAQLWCCMQNWVRMVNHIIHKKQAMVLDEVPNPSTRRPETKEPMPWEALTKLRNNARYSGTFIGQFTQERRGQGVIL